MDPSLLLPVLAVFTNKRGVDTAAIRAAEAELARLARHAGFGPTLLSLLAGAGTPDGAPLPRSVRHIATITLHRSLIMRYWLPGGVGDVAKPDDGEGEGEEGDASDGFSVADVDKADLRARLPALLSDADNTVRATVAISLAAIARCDWPEQWPGFTDGVLACLVNATTTDGACSRADDAAVAAWLATDGALQCLHSFLRDIATHHSPPIAQLMHPHVLALAQGHIPLPTPTFATSAFALHLRAMALDVLDESLGNLESAAHYNKTNKRAVLALRARDSVHIMAAVGAAFTLPGWSPAVCQVKVAAAQLLAHWLTHFPTDLLPYATAVVAGTVAFTVTAAAAFTRFEVESDYEESPIAGGEAASAEAAADLGVVAGPLDTYARTDEEVRPSHVLVAALTVLEALLPAQAGLRAPLRSHLPELALILHQCQLLSEATMAEWSDSPAAFVAYSSDSPDQLGGSLRLHGRDAMCSLVDALGVPMLAALLQRALATLAASAEQPTCAVRWKAVEAALFVVGAAHRFLVTAKGVTALATMQAAAMLEEAEAAGLSPLADGGAAAGAAAAGAGTARQGARRAAKAVEQRREAALAAAVAAIDVSLPITAATCVPQLSALLMSAAESAFTPADGADVRAIGLPYVLGRCLWCAARLAMAEDVPDAEREALVTACQQGLEPTLAVPVRLSACQSLNRLLSRLDTAVVEAHAAVIIDRVLALLTAIIADATAAAAEKRADVLARSPGDGAAAEAAVAIELDESAGKALDLLLNLTVYAQEATATAESTLTPLVLHIFCRKGDDVILGPVLHTLLSALVLNGRTDAASAALARIAPVLTSVLLAAAAHSPSGAGVASLGHSYSLPDGASLPLTTLTLTQRWVAGPVMLAAGVCSVLEDAMLKLREWVPPGGAGVGAGGYLIVPDVLAPSLAAMLDLAGVCQDTATSVSIARVLRTAVRLYGPNLCASQGDKLLAIAARFIIDSPETSSDVTGNAMPFATALMSHAGVPTLPAMLAPHLAQRLTSCASDITNALLVLHAISHAILLDPASVLHAMMAAPVTLAPGSKFALHTDCSSQAEAAAVAAAESAPGAVPAVQSALTVYARAACRYALGCSYVSEEAVLSAMATVAQDAGALAHLATVSVQGLRGVSAGGADAGDGDAGGSRSGRRRTAPATRSTTAGTRRYGQTPLAVKMVALLVAKWLERVQRAVRAAGVEADEEEAESGETDTSEDEEGDDGEDESDGGGDGERAGRSGAFADASRYEAFLQDDGAVRGGGHGAVRARDVVDMMTAMDALASASKAGLRAMFDADDASGSGSGSGWGGEDGMAEVDDAVAGISSKMRTHWDTAEMQKIDQWMLIETPGESGVVYAAVPPDPVTSRFVAATAEGADDEPEAGAGIRVATEAATATLTTMMTALAVAATNEGSPAHATAVALVAGVQGQLSDGERVELQDRVAALLAAQ